MSWFSSKRVLLAAGIIAALVAISVIIDISKTYEERTRLKRELAAAVIDNQIMHDRFDAMQVKLKAREDESNRISTQLARQKTQLDKALQQNRVWSSSSVPTDVSNRLQSVLSDQD